jgi:hypothetical protein
MHIILLFPNSFYLCCNLTNFTYRIYQIQNFGIALNIYNAQKRFQFPNVDNYSTTETNPNTGFSIKFTMTIMNLVFPKSNLNDKQTKMPLKSYKNINQVGDGVLWPAKVKAATTNKSIDGVSSLERSSYPFTV